MSNANVPAVTADIYGLIDDKFDTANTSLADRPEIHTGKWDRDQRLPAIAVYGQSGGPVGGGTTGATAYASGGGFHQRISGQVTVDCVAGTRANLEGAGSNGGDLNPKLVRKELHAEVNRILVDYRPSSLRTCLPGDYEDAVSVADAGDTQPLFSRRVPAQFTYDNG